MQIDHVTIAGPDLAALRRAMASIQLSVIDGGAHTNGATHMALHAFADGSYIEVISTIEPGAPSPWWHDHIHGSAGPCAWAVRCRDIGKEVTRLRSAGVEVQDPTTMGRTRGDGRELVWHLAKVGPGEPGTCLPFLIEDVTPREWRVAPPEAPDHPLQGVARVILAVPDLDTAVALFRRAFRWHEPDTQSAPHLDAMLAAFHGTPVILAAPTDPDGRVARRLQRFGPCPYGFILETTDLTQAQRALELKHVTDLFGKTWARPPANEPLLISAINS